MFSKYAQHTQQCLYVLHRYEHIYERLCVSPYTHAYICIVYRFTCVGFVAKITHTTLKSCCFSFLEFIQNIYIDKSHRYICSYMYVRLPVFQSVRCLYISVCKNVDCVTFSCQFVVFSFCLANQACKNVRVMIFSPTAYMIILFVVIIFLQQSIYKSMHTNTHTQTF